MPAVRAFALYAAVALSLNFFMQITCFVAVMALDARRQDQLKFDVFCCWGSSVEHDENVNKSNVPGEIKWIWMSSVNIELRIVNI